jgi:hypothetical protein
MTAGGFKGKWNLIQNITQDQPCLQRKTNNKIKNKQNSIFLLYQEGALAPRTSTQHGRLALPPFSH